MAKVKICGLSREEDVSYVNQVKPDYAGFIIDVPKSRRNVSVVQVKELVKQLDKNIIPVGVFVDAPVDEILHLAQQNVIGMIQLHGKETQETMRRLRQMTSVPIIKAFSVDGKEAVEQARKSQADYILLDQGTGGTGKSFHWEYIKGMERMFFLAGGISIYNVKKALAYGPYALDISSGVETDGAKDFNKIKTLVEYIRKEN